MADGTSDRQDVDIVVIGSGVAGLTAAVAAGLNGLSPVVLEHLDEIGGTSARSSGTVWVPDNPFLRAAGVTDDRAKAEAYLASLVGERGNESMWRTFMDAGPAMLVEMDAKAGLAFKPYMASADYRQDHEGAAPGGRALEPPAFDGRTLGDDFPRIAWPLPELMLFGRMMISRGEAFELVRVDRSLKSMALAVRLIGRYFLDRLKWPRGTRLVLGNALVARLLKVLRDDGVPVLTRVRTTELIREGRRVVGVAAEVDGRPTVFRARRGVVLAGGGFPADDAWRAEHLPKPVAAYTPASPGSDGSSLELGLAAGGVLGPSGLDNAFWFPSSIATRPDGTTAVYPHIVLDRSRPGLIAVNSTGKRFVDEAVSYHEFVRAMYRADKTAPSIPAWLVCDRQFTRRYGFGMILPRTPSLRKYIDSGYLKTGRTVAELAAAIGVPAIALEQTVATFNAYAETGVDTEFGKGGNIYDRANGDAEVGPNPCLGPITTPPFCAVAVVPTPLATSRGLLASPDAQVTDADGQPIPGLYVCGNDMQSIFGGEYPGAGAQLGQAMTFAWLAARHAGGANDPATPPLNGDSDHE